MSSTIDLFSRKIMDIKKELTNLKTAHFKTATQIATTSSERSLSFNLTLDYLSGEIASDKVAVITLTSTDSTKMISAVYIKNITPSNIDSRFVHIHRRAGGSSTAVYEVWVYSQNESDYNTLSGGGTVSLSYTIQMVASSNFTSSVSWESI